MLCSSGFDLVGCPLELYIIKIFTRLHHFELHCRLINKVKELSGISLSPFQAERIHLNIIKTDIQQAY